MDAIITIDGAQNIVQFNAGAERIFGYESQEMIGRSVHDLLPEHFRKSHHKHIQSFRETGATLRNTWDLGILTELRANGEIFPLEISISSVTIGDKKFHFAIIRDVSERVKLEGPLVHSHTQNQKALELNLLLLYSIYMSSCHQEREMKYDHTRDALVRNPHHGTAGK